MPDERFVTFKNEQFKVADGVALMALMRFAHIAKGGTDSGEFEGLAAMYDLLESAIHADDWGRFQDVAVKTRATDKDLMLLVRRVITGQTEGPTQQPSDSSDGPTSTEQKSESEEESSEVAEQVETWLRVKTRHEAHGRPDRALMVLMAHEQQVASAS